MTSRNYLILKLVVALGTAGPLPAQDWVPLGPDDRNWPCDRDFGDDGFILDPSGHPVIAYRGYYLDEGITVRRWSGSHWQTVGPVGFANSSSGPCLATDVLGGLFVAYQDPDNGYRISVQQWTGGTWQLVGVAGFSPGQVSLSGLEVDPQGRPVVAFTDGALGNRASVWHWTGLIWEPVGFPGFSMGGVADLDLAVDPAGDPVVAYCDNANGKRTTVQRWNGSDWAFIGVAGFSPDSADSQDIALDEYGNPVVIYEEMGWAYNDHTTVQRWDGASWTFVGPRGFSEHWSRSPRIAVGPTGELAVAYLDDGSNGYEVMVQTWNGVNWQQYGSGLGSQGLFSLGLAIDQSGVPFVGYTNLSYGGRTTVQQLYGSSWMVLGDLGFSVESAIVGASKVSLALEPMGKPLVAYSDAAHFNKLTVRRWNGVSWQCIGPAGFAQGGGSSALVVDHSGRPVVAYQDGPYGRASVRRWNGASWELVGPAEFSVMQAYYLDLALDADGDPVVAYRDRANGYKTTVQRWNGSAWEVLGPAGFTTDAAENQTLVLDDSGNPIVAHRYGSQNGVHVHRWNGSVWQELGGSPAYSTWTNTTISLTLDNTDAPILAYVSYSLNEGLTVRRWNGSVWELLGPEGFASRWSRNICLSTDPEGDPLIAYVDGGAIVQRWSGSSWQVVGSPGLSAVISADSKRWLQVDHKGRAVVAYASGGVYAKAYPDADFGVNSIAGELYLGPNPNSGAELLVRLVGLSAEIKTIEAELYDLSGRRIRAWPLPVQDGRLNTWFTLPQDLAGGMYVVSVRDGDSRWSARLVVSGD